MEIKHIKSTSNNIYYDKSDDFPDSYSSTTSSTNTGDKVITPSELAERYGTDPVSGLPRVSPSSTRIGPYPQPNDGKSRLVRAIDLEKKANAMPEGELKQSVLKTAKDAQTDSKIQIANEDYETRRALSEKYARKSATQTTPKQEEARQAIRDVRSAGFDRTESGKETIGLAERQIAKERESQGRAAEQTYRHEEAILDQRRDKRIEAYEREANAKPIPESPLKKDIEAIKARKTAQEEIDKHEGARDIPGPGDSRLPHASEPTTNKGGEESSVTTEDETITFNIESVEDAKNKIKSFITSLGEILEKYKTTFGPYTEMNEELYTEELANSISNITNEFSTQFETLSEDADAYANWLGTAAKEAAQAMKEAEGIAQESSTGPTREIM